MAEPGSDVRDRRSRATSALWERVASSASEEEDTLLREEVVLLNLSVALAIAARYRSKGIPLDDLRQVASLGLVKAAKRFDPTMGRDFLSYAVPTIGGEVKRHFRDRAWAVRPPRRVQELQARISGVSADSAQSPGSMVRPTEVAAQLGVDVSEVIEALTCNGFSPMSLEVPLGEPGSSASFGDLLSSGRDDFSHVENVIVLRAALTSLSPRDLLIVHRRFFEDRTQQQVGQEIGLSQMQVSRVQARILTQLRALIEPTRAA